MDKTTQAGLPLDNAIKNPHLTAQGGQENNQLDGVHIMCNHYQLRLLLFHQIGDSINLRSKDRWLLGSNIPFAGSFFLS